MDPITIEPEMIGKFGFKKISANPTKWEYDGFTLVEVDSNFHFYSIGPVGKIILYVHELQNLFYALYGNELLIEF